jgi:hypothetical protein
MDVTLPDGRLIQGVPDGIGRAELMRRVAAMDSGASKPQSGITPKQREQFANDAFERDDSTLEFATPFGRIDTRVPIGKIPLVGRSVTKGLANLGAGFDSAWTGAKQLVGAGPGDEAIKQKRLEDEALADVTTGGGALQVVGEALPTMVVPMGSAARGVSLAARGARALPGAVARQTARVAGREIAPAVISGGRAAELAGAHLVADSALMGAAGGALAPTLDDESKLANAAIGGTVGAVLPGVARLARGGYETFARGGAANKAAREVREAIAEGGGDLAGVNQRLTDYGRRAGDPNHIPLTTAGAAGDAGIARLEAGARARNGARFYDIDQQQGRRIHDAVIRDTADADQLVARRGQRSGEWDANWQQAQDAADPEVWARELPAFRQNLDRAMRSPEASNPQVRNVLSTVADEIDRLGEDFTPAHLQQIRANLNQRGAGAHVASPNAYQSAPRESHAVDSLLQGVDDVMNQTTNGAWGGVTDAYRAGSRLVDQSKASGRVREQFFEPVTGRIKGKSLDAAGDVAKITENQLGTAIGRGAGPDKLQRLSPEAQRGLSQTLEAIRAQNIVQRVKGSATAGGGSNTLSDAFAAQALDAIPGGGVPKTLMSGIANLAQRRKDEAMVNALRNPEAMQALLARATRNPGDLSPTERALVKALRQYTSAGAVDVMQ